MGYLTKIKNNNNYKEEDKTPFVIDNKRVGQVRQEYLDTLLQSEIFELQHGVLMLAEHLKTFDARTEALKQFAEQMVKRGLTNRMMHENYPLIEKSNSKPLAFIDRSISTLLGSIAFGQHLNAYVMTSEGMKMWIGRRAYDKPHHPGKLDHLVAGGLPYDISPEENLKKECYEEAGMSAELASQARSVGLVSYKYEYELGGKRTLSTVTILN